MTYNIIQEQLRPVATGYLNNTNELYYPMCNELNPKITKNWTASILLSTNEDNTKGLNLQTKKYKNLNCYKEA